jgi:hypothetical protein
MHKLGVIVPYRNRFEQLVLFKEKIVQYLNNQKINFEIIVIEQDDAKLFNRGMLLNIGFKHAKEKGCDYVVFHDVDMLPINVDYSYSNIPLHLATNFTTLSSKQKRIVFDEYFGGVTMFPIELFEKIDGYSNKYWGWGYEDDDLLFRCKEKFIPLDEIKIKNTNSKKKALEFNGINSYVKAKNIIDFNSSFTIFVSFYPNPSEFNHQKQSDEYTVFSIPGYDFAIAYTSFRRYNFCAFDNDLNALYVNSNIKPNYKTNMVITFDATDKIFKVYQDGKFIGETKSCKRIYSYRSKPNFYLGVGKPDREIIPNYFKGFIDAFAYYDTLLSDKEIKEISKTKKLLNELNSGISLKTYYDANHIEYYMLKDLSENENDGEIVGCSIVDMKIDSYTKMKIPYKKKSLFQLLPHEENGFLGNKWKDQSTRWNQLRFQNEVRTHISLINNDGLSTLEYYIHGINEYDNNITQINVAI